MFWKLHGKCILNEQIMIVFFSLLIQGKSSKVSHVGRWIRMAHSDAVVWKCTLHFAGQWLHKNIWSCVLLLFCMSSTRCVPVTIALQNQLFTRHRTRAKRTITNQQTTTTLNLTSIRQKTIYHKRVPGIYNLYLVTSPARSLQVSGSFLAWNKIVLL